MPSELLSSIMSGGSGNPYPVFEYDADFPQPNYDPTEADSLPGFDGDGDTISLPTTTTGQIQYRDPSNNAVTDGAWNGSLYVTEINASAYGWVGFHMSADGSLLYVIAIDNSPVTFYLATIDKAGVINNIGSVSASTYNYSVQTVWPRTSVTRDPTGGGNLFIRNENGHESELDIATGQFVSGKEYVLVAPFSNPYWKTENGIYCGFYGISGPDAYGQTVFIQGSKGIFNLNFPTANGGPSNQGYLIADWRGRVVFCDAPGRLMNSRAVTYENMNKLCDDLAKAVGVY